MQTPPVTGENYFFYFDKTIRGAWKSPVGKLIIIKAVFLYNFFNSIVTIINKRPNEVQSTVYI